MIILGIDPGTAITGFGVVESVGNKYKPINYGCLRTGPELSLDLRLKLLYQGIMEVIVKYRPFR
ncbi:hypothetical protein N752_04370 [Desulforamulus aquiferis]|nr:hypothetical protein N752_04370 [Desulforamulus aquiferis]